MTDEPRVPKIGYRIRDKPIVEFLRIVDLVPAGNAGDMNVANTVEVIAQIPGDITV